MSFDDSQCVATQLLELSSIISDDGTGSLSIHFSYQCVLPAILGCLATCNLGKYCCVLLTAILQCNAIASYGHGHSSCEQWSVFFYGLAYDDILFHMLTLVLCFTCRL